MSLMSRNYVGAAHRTENYVRWYLLIKAHRGTGWGSSPLQENHPGLSFIRGGEEQSVTLLSFVSLSPYLQLLTPLDYNTDYSLWIHSTDDKTDCSKKFQPVACRVHTPHTLIIEVCFFDAHVYRPWWIHVRMDHVKSAMSAKVITWAFSTKSYFLKSINLDALIYNKSITS